MRFDKWGSEEDRLRNERRGPTRAQMAAELQQAVLNTGGTLVGKKLEAPPEPPPPRVCAVITQRAEDRFEVQRIRRTVAAAHADPMVTIALNVTKSTKANVRAYASEAGISMGEALRRIIPAGIAALKNRGASS